MRFTGGLLNPKKILKGDRGVNSILLTWVTFKIEELRDSCEKLHLRRFGKMHLTGGCLVK